MEKGQKSNTLREGKAKLEMGQILEWARSV